MKYDYEFEVSVGVTVKFNGSPYEHLGGGRFGGNTNPEKVYANYWVNPPPKLRRANQVPQSHRNPHVAVSH